MNPFEPRSTYNKRAHIIPATCPRHPFTVTSPDAQLRLAVNEYRSCRSTEAGITLVLTHGTSFNKDLWEPLIQQWMKHDSPLSIRRVLALDAANHGDSAVLNEEELGATTYWPDHSYDILQVLSYFGVASPVVGIGHSFGGGTMAHAAVIAPDRFLAVILVEPILFQMKEQTDAVARRASGRKDKWKDLESVKTAFASSKVMAEWDADQRDRYAVRRPRLPLFMTTFPGMLKEEKTLGTRVISKGSRSYRTLKTPKEQEAATYRAAPYPEILSLLSTSLLRLCFVLGTSSVVLDSKRQQILETLSTGRGETRFMHNAGHLIPMTHPKALGNLLECLLLKVVGTTTAVRPSL